MTFGEKLLCAAATRGRLCVGIDPHASLLQSWGLSDDAEGVAEFSRRCVEAFADTAALVKPQVAFYERHGSAGFRVLEETLVALREAGCLVVADAKRGDIGSTMAGYAHAWLGEGSTLQTDAVTVSPYLGVGSLRPVFELAEATGRGVFVLAATSNPEAVELQSHVNSDGRTIAQQVVDECAALNASHSGPGNIGVVVGATLASPPNLSRLNGPVLLPGVGAQGANAQDVARIAAGVSNLAFPNVSRAILSAGPNVSDLRKAVLSTASEFPGH
ncbi:orotidine 5'-phosphate decarboxylase [Corynebacterium atrinae]|uniref:orotidine-5'-phosphate decarboxylase n=1 Tax=Corynebacterium atrinae TaxID=1336740 RepID=UPI0025B4D7A3|nr:orotidine-5'-phosphate decarboxylase [Corynebacterium atrinae]WJY63482.1 orotidine 5'-phosphate decarboxylase [Corynebacterium atrinae]